MRLDDLDDEDSNYIKLGRYKKRYMALKRQTDKLKNMKTSLGRKSDKKFHSESSRIPMVNERVQDLINKERRFPDFHDILTIYKDVCEKNNLGYSTSKLTDMGKDFLDMFNINHGKFLETFQKYDKENKTCIKNILFLWSLLKLFICVQFRIRNSINSHNIVNFST